MICVDSGYADDPFAIPASWRVSEVMHSCDGPAGWESPDFGDSEWAEAILPDTAPVPQDQEGDRFYRGYFTASAGERVSLEWQSDDGSWIFLNGQFLTHEGADCHTPGCAGMDCGNSRAVGGKLDLTPHLQPGPNVLAIHVSNAGGWGGSYFNATLRQDPEKVEVQWSGSEVMESCEGPDGWTGWSFDDSTWTAVAVPDNYPIPWDRAADKFYRGTFEGVAGNSYLLRWKSDDGSWIHINGQFVVHEGGDCHRGGCVGLGCNKAQGPRGGIIDITPFVQPGPNLIAAHLSNMAVCCGSYFDAVIETAPLSLAPPPTATPAYVEAEWMILDLTPTPTPTVTPIAIQ
jgi:hypothetical protein